MKFCKRCELNKAPCEFGKDQRNFDGLTFYCRVCKSDIKKTSHLKSKEKWNSKSRDYHRNHRKEICERKRTAWARMTAEQKRSRYRNWAEANRGVVNFIAARKRARRKNATPEWLSEDQWKEIRELYENCQEGFHVDHIIPLHAVNSQKEHVACGLHVPWNLQYLPARLNIQKKNFLPQK